MAAGEPQIIRDKDQMRRWSRAMRSQGKTVDLVPTMGYLHDRQVSLIREARTHADVLAVSIYVNPGQSPLPKTSPHTSPISTATSGSSPKFPAASTSFLTPTTSTTMELTLTQKHQRVMGHVRATAVKRCPAWRRRGRGTRRVEKGMCGRSRPVFFRGVATVVSKLLNIVEPDVAVFGKKDYQQWRIIQRMVRDLDFSTRVIGSEIVRENDGLAMSSRNVRLSPEEREKAPSISKSLSKAKSSAERDKLIVKS
ncbi:pantoate--beta-alanine ligase-like [Pyrus ussuriensis x Pyrus communis]|uniref:Pantoate--beta-alanine ligase n=1 Tax=Pyrus ussuriensis x Pyrus communis TaxID=2448454 RepID=A0A5N5I8S1_9ROSA|nr:pantoate--beta-alanine ligase-like [Pyrus ussuriensis x Pyrus communis]